MPEESAPPERLTLVGSSLEPAVAPLPALIRVQAVKPIPREAGVEIAAGQIAWLPAEAAKAAIKDGLAKDPDSKPEPKAAEPDPKGKAKD